MITGHKSESAVKAVLSGRRAPALTHSVDSIKAHHAQVALHAAMRRPVISRGLSPALASAHLNSPELGGCSFPHWGFLEYLALTRTDTVWNIDTQMKRNKWTVPQLSSLLGLTQERVRTLMNWWRGSDEGFRSFRNMGRLKAPEVYDLAAGMGVPLGGLLVDARKRNDVKVPNIGLPMALNMIEVIRPQIEAFDRWVFHNLTCNFFSVIDQSKFVRIEFRHRRTLDEEPLYSSWHHSISEKQLEVMSPELRQLARNLRQLLKDTHVDYRRRVAAQHVEPLEEHRAYWVTAIDRLRRMKENAQDLPDLRDYVRTNLEPSEYNQYDYLPTKFPNQKTEMTEVRAFDKYVPDAELKYFDLLVEEDRPQYMPAQDVWWEGLNKKIKQLPRSRIESWLPIHRSIMAATLGVIKETVYCIQPGVYHGAWLWLGEINRHVDVLMEGIQGSEKEIRFNLSALFSLVTMLPQSTSVDVDAFSQSWDKVRKMPQLLAMLEIPYNFLMPPAKGLDEASLSLPMLKPKTLEVLEQFTHSLLTADGWTVSDSLRKVVTSFTVDSKKNRLGTYRFHGRAMRNSDPTWVDVLYQLKVGEDLRPRRCGLVQTNQPVPTWDEMFTNPVGSVAEAETISELRVVESGHEYMGRLWAMSPGTTAGSGNRLDGTRVKPMDHRLEVLDDFYNDMPQWKPFMQGRWKHLDEWFCWRREVGSTFTEYMRTRDRSAVENSLCDTEGHIRHRLLPILKFAHIPVAVFIKWMMNLREAGREIAACHYYITNEPEKIRGKEVKPMKLWKPPCLPLENRNHDQLYLLWGVYITEAERRQLEVPPELQKHNFEQWYDFLEERFAFRHKEMSEKELADRRKAAMAEQIQESKLDQEAVAAQQQALKELEADYGD